MLFSQLNEYLKGLKDSYGILVAPYFSDAGRQICREAGIGCLDLAGNAFGFRVGARLILTGK